MGSIVVDLVRTLGRRGLLSRAAALAFNALWSLPPLVLLLLALAGFLDLTTAWSDHLGPEIQSRVTPEMWRASNTTVDRILDRPHLACAVVGAVLAVWHVSALVRATTDALNEVLEQRERRGAIERVWKSVAVAVPVVVLACLALLAVVAGRLLASDGISGAAVFVGRWAVAAVALWALLAIIIRAAPSARPHAKWVSIGALLAVGGWIGASIRFGIYVGYIADFRSAYGNLISVMVVMAYTYTLSVTFLAGVQLDVLVAERT